MKIVVAGRFDYMRVAWKKAANNRDLIYFDDSLLPITFNTRIRRRIIDLLFRKKLLSNKRHDEFLQIDNLREMFNIDSIKRNDFVIFIIYEMNMISTDYKCLSLLKKDTKKQDLSYSFLTLLEVFAQKLQKSFLLIEKCMT